MRYDRGSYRTCSTNHVFKISFVFILISCFLVVKGEGEVHTNPIPIATIITWVADHKMKILSIASY